MIITTIQKWGNSQGIQIPKHLLDFLKWSQDEKIIMYIQNNCLIIEQVTKPQCKTIQKLFNDFNGDYIPCEIDWGKSKGKEIG